MKTNPTRPIFPRLSNNEIVEISGSKYRAEWWSTRFYRFIYLGDREGSGKFNFERTEAEVSQAIKDNKIKRK
jgi:hypothetical protein